MPRIATGNTLHVTWTISPADAHSVDVLRNRLADGHDLRLYQLDSWTRTNEIAEAVLTPIASLEDIVEVIWSAGLQPAALCVGTAVAH